MAEFHVMRSQAQPGVAERRRKLMGELPALRQDALCGGLLRLSDDAEKDQVVLAEVERLLKEGRDE